MAARRAYQLPSLPSCVCFGTRKGLLYSVLDSEEHAAKFVQRLNSAKTAALAREIWEATV